MSGAGCKFSGLLADATGNVLPLAAIGMVMAAAMIGGGVDMGRAYRVQARLQAACDAGVLAGRRAVDSGGYGSAAKLQAESYFNANFVESKLDARDTVFRTTSAENGNIINGTAETSVDTAVMQMFGFEDFDLTATCTASMGVGNSDVVMVLDTTGSMAGTRIEGLRTAMKNFYDTVKTATQGSNSRIRYGFVPYSQSVNVGGLLMAENPNYIVDTYRVQTRIARTRMEYSGSWLAGTSDVAFTPEWAVASAWHSSDTWDNLWSCNSNKPANVTEWTNSGSATTSNWSATTINGSGQQQRSRTTTQLQYKRNYECQVSWGSRYRIRRVNEVNRNMVTTVTNVRDPVEVFDHWDYQESTYDVSDYKNFQTVSTNTGSSGASVTSAVWNGCIEERDTVNTGTFSYSSITGVSPAEAYDLDLDLVPDPADDATRWKPMWNEVSYYRALNAAAVTTSGSKAGFVCPRAAQLMKEMDEGEFDAYADSLTPNGSTYLDLGLLWGGRLASPDGIFKDNVSADPNNGGEVSRHVIFMTDGDMDPTQTSQTSYGVEQTDRRIGDGTDATAKARHLARFRVICEAIKDKGIRVWTIAFGLPLSTDMRNCASANSAFSAANSAQLNTAFQEIAKQVGELRITQ